MLNCEKYKEDILNLLSVKNGEIMECDHDCGNCYFFKNNEDCNLKKIEWLYTDDKIKRKFTKFQFYLLQKLSEKFTWMARDKGEEYICCYKEKPVKRREVWYVEKPEYILLESPINDFPFIKWEDEEPYNINELLKNCEVE